jgi:2-oxoglutarate ferredoxin oxidoreductase subunit delta
MSQIQVNIDRCKRCGLCVDLCPLQVYVTGPDGCPEPANIEKCTKCRMCELWCPDYALEIIEV